MKMKKLVTVLLSLLLVLTVITNIDAASFRYRMNGGVGNNGARLYYTQSSMSVPYGIYAASWTGMNKWIYTPSGTYTPVYFIRTTTDRPNSVVDMLYDNYGHTKWHGLTTHKIRKDDVDADRTNWNWALIEMNNYYGFIENGKSVGENVASHELGHAFGLAHNYDDSSIMSKTSFQALHPNVNDANELTRKYRGY